MTCTHGSGEGFICARCEGRKGGTLVAARYTYEQRREWGKLGGRPKGKRGHAPERKTVKIKLRDRITGATYYRRVPLSAIMREHLPK